MNFFQSENDRSAVKALNWKGIMKDRYSIAEIADVLGSTKRAAQKRANQENWSYEEIATVGNRGNVRMYFFSKLPTDIKKKIVSHQIGCALDFIPSKNINISHAEACLRKWNKATPYNKKIAQARDHILNKLSKFIISKGLKQVQGRERFASFYKAGLIEVEPWILEKIPSVSAPNLGKWIKRKIEDGLPGLLGGYGNQKGQRKAVTPEQSAFIISHIKAKPHIRPEHIFKMVCKIFETHPSRRTIYRFINSWKQENEQFFALIEDPRRWKNNYMPAFGDASADVPHFGHTWEIDSTPADIITKDGKRLAVIGVIDIYSRRAVILIAPTSKSIAIAAAFRKAMIAWGIPTRIRMDNGADYQSFHVQAITSSFKIETPELPKYSPEKKPFVERYFGSFSIGFEELLPGFCGHSVPERQSIRERETWSAKIMKRGGTVELPLSSEDFQSLTDRWVSIYEVTPHEGLNGKTPLGVAKESHLQPQKIRDERILDILLAPVGRRTVQKQGVSVDGAYFVSPELIEHIGRRVEIRRDLNNAGLLYVFDASTGKYLCKAKNEPLAGQSLEDYLIAKKKHFKGLKERAKALDKIGLSNRTPIQILLEDEIEHDNSNVIPFQGNFENQAVKEAKEAVADIDVERIDESPDQIPKAVNYYHSMDHLIDHSTYMTEEDYNRELEEMKECRRKNITQID